MKKLLVVLMAAIMVLSMAAVSMAAATVEGDWRAEWVQDGSSTTNDKLAFSSHDLRLNFKGKVSDTVDAYMQYTFGSSTALKEYYVTFNQSWAKVMAGQWDYKLVPSRVLLKPHGALNCVNGKNEANNNMQWLFDIPVGDAMTVGLWMIPDLTKDALDYDVKFAYKADSFGAEVHYGVDTKIDSANYAAFDFYYNITDGIKAFVYGVNISDELKGNTKLAKNPWEDNLAPVIGATFKTGNLTSSIEYALEETDADYTEYALQFKYGFNNKVNLEVEYQNVNKDDAKLVIRPRVKF